MLLVVVCPWHGPVSHQMSLILLAQHSRQPQLYTHETKTMWGFGMEFIACVAYRLDYYITCPWKHEGRLEKNPL